MPTNTALRFKSGKGKSIRIDKINAQKRKDVKRKFNHFKSLSVTILLFLFSLAFLGSFFVYRNLNQHFASADSFENYQSDYPTTSYFVVENIESNPIILKKLVLVVSDTKNNTVTLFEVPVDAKLDLFAKYSDLSFKDIFMLGGVSNENRVYGGVDLVNRQLFKLFGFNVDNFILIDSSKEDVLNKLIYNGDSIFPFGGLSPSSMDDNFLTSYNMKNFYQFQSLLNNVSSDNYSVKQAIQEKSDITSFIDNVFIDMTMSSDIANEKKTISVLNGTNLSGVATLAGRVINNIGGRVVAMENSSSKYDDTVLVVDELDSSTVAYIKKVFNVKLVYTKEQASFIKEDALTRSDIVLFIGFDLEDRLY